jgi:hypothetical protein
MGIDQMGVDQVQNILNYISVDKLAHYNFSTGKKNIIEEII